MTSRISLFAMLYLLLHPAFGVTAQNVTVSYGNDPVQICSPETMVLTFELDNPPPSSLNFTFNLDVYDAPVVGNPVLKPCHIDDPQSHDPNVFIQSASFDVQLTGATLLPGLNEVVVDIPDLNGLTEFSIELNYQIDCAIAPWVGGNSTVWLIPDFPSLNVTNSPPVPPQINRPYFINGTASTFNAFYSEDATIVLAFQNTGDEAALEFSMDFFTGLQTCSGIDLSSVTWTSQIGSGASSPYNPTDPVVGIVPSGETIYFTGTGLIIDCLSDCTGIDYSFSWRCPGQIPGACESCQEILTGSFDLLEAGSPSLRVERTIPSAPPAVAWDNSCPNTTTSWSYVVTNDGDRTIAETLIDLSYLSTLFGAHVLTLIDEVTYSFSNSGQQSTLDIQLWNQPGSQGPYCADAVEDPIRSWKLTVLDLAPGDQVTISFDTYRCCEYNEDLYNVGKWYNWWRLLVSGTDECEDNVPLTRVGGILDLGYVGSDPFNSAPDLDLELYLLPTTSDISVFDGVPPGTANECINLLGLFGDGRDRQLLGNTSSTNPSIYEGLIRVRIECDAGLRVEDITSDVHFADAMGNVLLSPVSCETSYDYNTCEPGSFTAYFEMNQLTSANLLNLFNSGTFCFELTGCCGGDIPPTSQYEVFFDLLPVPNANCQAYSFLPPQGGGCGILETEACFIPLSSDGFHINVHCPGCTAPGMIIQHYEMKRSNYGLEDSTDDRIADGSGIPINSNYSHFNDLNLQASIYGDVIEDRMAVWFFDGDPNSGGYSYNQNMLGVVDLQYLQLFRRIPMYVDYDLHPVSVDLYIDVPDNVNPNCIDPDGYGIDANDFRTILHYKELDPFGSGILSEQNDEILISYTIADLVALVTGWNNTPNLFTQLEGDQYFRVQVTYEVCGNKSLPYVGPGTSIYDATDLCEMTNVFWASYSQVGLPDPYANYPQAPGDHPGTFDQNWVDSVQNSLFYCEAYGGIHHFYKISVVNNHDFSADGANFCVKRHNIRSSVFIANGSNVYPFEVRTPPVTLSQMSINPIPDWQIDFVNYNTRAWHDGNPNSSNSIIDPSFVGPSTSLVTIGPGQFPIAEFMNANWQGAHMAGDEHIEQRNTIYLSPETCIPGAGEQISYTDLLMTHTLNPSSITSSISSSGCTDPLEIVKNLTSPVNINIYQPNPDLSILVTPTFMQVGLNQVCWEVTIDNNSPNSESYNKAPFVYLSIPQNQELGNWSSTVGTINNGVLEVTNLLSTATEITFEICAEIVSCPDQFGVNEELLFQWGWDCDGFPALADIGQSCYTMDETVLLQFLDPSFEVSVQSPGDYGLCDSFLVSLFVTSLATEGLLEQVGIPGPIPPGLNVTSVTAVNCGSGTEMELLDAGLTTWANAWDVGPQVLTDIGISDGLLGPSDCVEFVFEFVASCGFDGSFPDLDVVLYNYCGDLVTGLAQPVPSMTYNGMNTCQEPCTSCEGFSLSYVNTQGCEWQFEVSSPGLVDCADLIYVWDFGFGSQTGTSIMTYDFGTLGGSQQVCVNVQCISPIGEVLSECSDCVTIECSSVNCEGVSFIATELNECLWQFEAVAPNMGGCGFIEYNWDFGDGNSDTGPLVDHTFQGTGQYLVCLTVSCYDFAGNLIEQCEYCYPVDVHCASPDCEGIAIGYSSHGECDWAFWVNTPGLSGCASLGYFWTFGDGAVSSLASPSHTYTSPGTYQVCVEVRCYDIYGNVIVRCTDCVTIDVVCPGGCEGIGIDMAIGHDCQVNFAASPPASFSNCSQVTFLWNFGDNTYGNGQFIQHTYTPGAYTVCLTVECENSNGDVIDVCTYCENFEVNCEGGIGELMCFEIVREEYKEVGASIISDGAQGFTLVGTWNYEPFNEDFYLASVDATYSSPLNVIFSFDDDNNIYQEQPYHVLEYDGDFYVTGSAHNTDIGNNDLVVARIDGIGGGIVWANKWDSGGNEYGVKSMIIEGSTGPELLVVGNTDVFDRDLDVLAARLDLLSGTMIDHRTYRVEGKNYPERASDFIQLEGKDEFIIVGTVTAASDDIFSFKINSQLDYVSAPDAWNIYTSKKHDLGFSVIEHSDYVYILGSTYGWGVPSKSIWLLEVDKATLDFSGGNPQTSLITIPNFDSQCYRMEVSEDKHILMVGEAFPASGDGFSEALAMKVRIDLGNTGHLSPDWIRLTTDEFNEGYYNLDLESGGTFLAVGTYGESATDQNIFVSRINAEKGDNCCLKEEGFEIGDKSEFRELAGELLSTEFEDKKYLGVAFAYEPKLICPNEFKSSFMDQIDSKASGCDIFPNPTEQMLTVRLTAEEDCLQSIRITDLSGRLVHTFNPDPNTKPCTEAILNLDGLSEGVYLVHVDGKFTSVSERILIVR